MADTPNLNLPPIPSTFDKEQLAYLTALTKVLQQKQNSDYSAGVKMQEAIDGTMYKKGTALFTSATQASITALATPLYAFGSQLFNDSENITRLSNTQITLKSGKKYNLKASLWLHGSGADTFTGYQFYNVTSGSYIGNISMTVTAIHTSPYNSQPIAEAFISTTVDTVIELRTAYSVSGTMDLIASSTGCVSIEEVEAYLPIVTEGYSEIDQSISGAVSKIQCEIGAGIIETGSNTNGRWIKFSDGTMIQWGNRGPLTANTQMNYTLPYAFYDSNYSVSGGMVPSTTGGAYFSIWAGGTTYFSVYCTSTNYANWHAIGRWKA